MTRKHRYAIWIDLETTGSTLDGNVIIEIGAAITDMSLNVLDKREFVLPILAPVEMDPVVIDMHTKNGLLDAVSVSTDTQGEVDNHLAEWVREFNGSNHMLLAGSGVMHFDRQFIKRDLPLLDKRLSYYAIDVGVIRRAMTLFAVPEESEDAAWPNKKDNMTHRALDDVLFHIEEMRYAVKVLRTGYYGGNLWTM